MLEPTVKTILFAAAILLFSLAAGVFDFRYRRIPNWMTIPTLLLGFAYQAAFNGWPGLLDSLMGMGIGVGPLLILWLMGNGGGGDVKLMGALSAWLGFRMTFMLLIAIVLCVILGSLLMIIAQSVRRRRWAKKGADAAGETQPKSELTSEECRQERLVMPFAIPVGVATWLVVGWEIVKKMA